MLIKLSAFFAMYEVFKLFVGNEAILAESKKSPPSEMGCALLLIGIPYIAWSIWLIFTHTEPAIVLWALTLASAIVFQKARTHYEMFGRFDSLMCIALLILLYLGRI